MQSGAVVIIQNVLLLFIDLFIYFKTFRTRKYSETLKTFHLFVHATTVMQLLAVIVRLIKADIIPSSSAIQYIVYIMLFTVMTLSYCHCFIYLTLKKNRIDELPDMTLIFIFLPVVILSITSFVSPWTHWVFYIDENHAFRNGPLHLLQIICPYVYIPAACISGVTQYILSLKKSGSYRFHKMIRNWLYFVIPSLAGCALQFFTDIDGGYFEIGTSVGMLLLFIELYQDEVEEKKRLESIKEMNERLSAEQDAKEKELKIVEALSREFTNIFIIDSVMKDSRAVKLESKISSMLDIQKFTSHPYYETVSAYMNKRVNLQDRQRMLEAVKLENVLNELKDKDEYSLTYLVGEQPDTHYYQLKYIKIEGSPLIIEGYQNVDSIMKEEQLKKEKLEAALNAAEEANRAKTVFLNNMSHDIRTPMNAIMGFTSLASSHAEDSEKVRDYLGKISVSSQHLLALINDVLDMSRIESGNVKIEEQKILLSEVLEEIKTIVQPSVEEKQQSFILEEQNIRHDRIIADRMRLNQIILNIVSNAIKYTGHGGNIKLWVTENDFSEDGYASFIFKVRDTGIGMSKEFQKHIFEAFTREDSNIVRSIQGTGLGMAITKNIVDLMGGKISVESEEGKGSVFTVELKCSVWKEEGSADGREGEVYAISDISELLESKKSLKSEAAVSDSTGNELSSVGKKRKCILLAEDNELNQEIAATILNENGFDVDIAVNGETAVEKMKAAEDGKYCLILMDLQMPVMNGIEAVREIRKLDGGYCRKVPVIAMTANAFEEDKKAAYESGMNGFVSKPFKTDELMKTIAENMI